MNKNLTLKLFLAYGPHCIIWGHMDWLCDIIPISKMLRSVVLTGMWV